jgi:microcystin-dependent protein
MSDPFIGEIRMFGGTFAPRGWAFCNGQILPIAQNVALFSLLGTSYGGDGRSHLCAARPAGAHAAAPG